jgi:predicted nucleic acid-binding Zn ribbon protein
MRKIGTTESGILVEIADDEVDALLDILSGLQPVKTDVLTLNPAIVAQDAVRAGLADSTVMPANAVPERTVATPRPVERASSVARPKTQAKSKTPHKAKACAVCGKEFSPKTSEKACSPECKRARELEQKRGYAKTTSGPVRQEKREARGLTKEARKKMLMNVATKMGIREPDPIEQMSAAARRENQDAG